ncbi:KilA domain-containing protein [Gammaproteobacteria bacterium]
MTDLIVTRNAHTITMTSREIAELVEKRHDVVKLSIERLAERGVITFPPLVETSFKDSAGKTQRTTEYRIGKRDSYIIVAQLSPEFTARLVDRWQELEARPAHDPANLTRIQILQMAIESESARLKLVEEKATLEAKIETDAPKVNLAEEISADERSAITIREAAKILGRKEKDVREKAKQMHYIFRNPRGQWEVYADTMRRGLMSTKAEYINGMLFPVPCFTPRGLSEIRIGMGDGDLLTGTDQRKVAINPSQLENP